MKKCYKCKQDKELCQFNADQTRADKHSNLCKDCKYVKNRGRYDTLRLSKEKEVARTKNLFNVVLESQRKLRCYECKESYRTCLFLCTKDKNFAAAIEKAYKIGDYETISKGYGQLTIHCLNCCIKKNMYWVNVS